MPDGRNIVVCTNDVIQIKDIRDGTIKKELKHGLGEIKWDGLVFKPSLLAVSPVGLIVNVWGGERQTIGVFDSDCPDMVFMFPSDVSINKVFFRRSCLITDDFGAVSEYRLVNFPKKPTIVTPVKMFLHDRNQWDQEFTVRCFWCDLRFKIDDYVLDYIASITRYCEEMQSQYLKLPDHVFDSERLQTRCPKCHESVRCNPYVIDNSVRLPD